MSPVGTGYVLCDCANIILHLRYKRGRWGEPIFYPQAMPNGINTGFVSKVVEKMAKGQQAAGTNLLSHV